MEGIAAEVSQKLKSAIKAKLVELGAYVDEELPNYVMVMVTNRRSKEEMDRELQLFLGANTSPFTSWLQTVWTKLEQVTVPPNPEKRRKSVEKKKKVKKSPKSSSDSESEKRSKKKRRHSSTSLSTKESAKKRKDEKVDVESKKSSAAKKMDDISLEFGLEVEELEGDEFGRKKTVSDLSIDEDDFLNIKEDFESGFLSDEELTEASELIKSVDDVPSKSASGRIKDIPISVVAKKSKSELDSKVIVSKKSKLETDTKSTISKKPKHAADGKITLKKSKPESETKSSSVRSDTKSSSVRAEVKSSSGRSDVKSLSEKSEFKSASGKAESKSASSKSIASRTDDEKQRNSALRMRKPVAARSRSPSRSRSRSPIKARSKTRSPPPAKKRETSPLVDARELINRKRAALLVNETRDEKRTQSVVHKMEPEREKRPRKDRLREEKSRRSRDRSPITTDKNGVEEETRRSPFDIERSDLKNDKMDLRVIKRTVFVERDNGENDDIDEKAQVRKSVVSQIIKYIDPVTTTSSKTMSKVVNVKAPAKPSASSSLIRKAVADAHKSTSVIKEEKKKEHALEVKTSNVPEKIKNPEFIGEEQPIEGYDEFISLDESYSQIEEMELELAKQQDAINSNDNMDTISNTLQLEEYDPTQNMPEFVVTLTGLDPKLYREDEIEEITDVDIPAEAVAEIMELEEAAKPKTKVPERCKFYPNCLNADQCIYHHPTVPCKLFPNCKFGNACLYVHPRCKFDTMCTRYDCPYLHSANKSVPAAPVRHIPTQQSVNSQPCKYYFNCNNPMCPFQHPSKICRFNGYCTNKNCAFSHTSLRHGTPSFPPSKYKWCRPKPEEMGATPGATEQTSAPNNSQTENTA